MTKKKKKQRKEIVITYADRSKDLIYVLQALGLDHHNRRAIYQG